MSALLAAVEIESGPSPHSSIIWLHGLGADGHDFEPIVPELGLPASLPVRLVFPLAPLVPVTSSCFAVMRAWYDVTGDGREDDTGIRASQARVETLLAREKARGIGAAAIVLAGFSQGGAIALQTGLRYPERLAGLLALSTYLPLADTLAAEASPANRAVPILMCHGLHDPLIPQARALRSRDALRALGYTVDWREYPMPHAVCAEEIADIGRWLRGVLRAA